MTETTTIQVRKDQAEQLQEIARENGNYKTAIDRVLEGWDGNGQAIDIEDARLLSQHLERAVAPYFADLVGVDDASEIREARLTETEALARDVQNQLDALTFQGALTEAEAERLMSSLKTIEERTGKLERQLEQMEKRR